MISVAMLRAVLRRPGLWAEAVRTWLAMRRRGWWRRPPFLPLPDEGYLRWRVATAYGTVCGPDGRAQADDLVAYLAWRRRMRRS